MNQFILSLIAAVFVGGVAGYLGSLLVIRKMGLVGGPLGHLALPGVALALVYSFDPFLGALATIILGGIFVWLLEMKTKAPMEALSGLIFSAGVALGFLILPFDDERRLEEALVGDITKINLQGAVVAVALSVLAFFVLQKIYSRLVLAEVSEDLAVIEGVNIKKYNLLYLASVGLVAALTVKIVGGLLPIGLMVIPALTIRNLGRNLRAYSLGSLILGSLGSLLGVSLFKAFPASSAGLLIILVLTTAYLVSLIFRR